MKPATGAMSSNRTEMRDTPPTANTRELRHFGLITGSIVAVLFGLLFPWLFDRAWPLWPWLTALVLMVTGAAAPAALGPVYRGWMRFGHVAGAINTRIILALTFYAMIFPIGAIMRLLGKDPLARSPDDDLTSYRIASKGRAKRNMENPF
ncbi:MAG: hypothetical protein FD165_2436 [Gammaproteobacteria bacterium]|nr:MAG: hypothetical protein FD165_2436 [Gammaproteobacteria bacterium]TND03650.1 MAG: hypothetical protein FD120_1806 [Gammaproteobacteria bacterium]